MASNTPNLGLLKKNTLTDGNDTFNVKTMMNDNWDKVDGAVGDLGAVMPTLGLPSTASVAEGLETIVPLKNDKANELELYKMVKQKGIMLTYALHTPDMRYSVTINNDRLELIDHTITADNVFDKVIDSVVFDTNYNINSIFGHYVVLTHGTYYWKTYEIKNGKLVLLATLTGQLQDNGIAWESSVNYDTDVMYGATQQGTTIAVKSILSGLRTDISLTLQTTASFADTLSITTSSNKIVLSRSRTSDKKDRIIVYDKLKKRTGILDVSQHFADSQDYSDWYARVAYCIYCDDSIAYLTGQTDNKYKVVTVDISDVDNIRVIASTYLAYMPDRIPHVKIDDFFVPSNWSIPLYLPSGDQVDLLTPVSGFSFSGVSGSAGRMFVSCDGAMRSANTMISWCFKKHNTWFSASCCFCGEQISIFGRSIP